MARLFAHSAVAACLVAAVLVAGDCRFDHIFTRDFCCQPAYVEECPGIEAGCCVGFDPEAARSFEDLQYTTINPQALRAHAAHLRATKGCLFEVRSLFQLVRVRALLAILAVRGRAAKQDYLAGLPDLVARLWNSSAYAQGAREGRGGFDWPMRVHPATPRAFWAAAVAPLLRSMAWGEDLQSLTALQEAARLSQHAFERLVMWDQWLRAASIWGPPPAVRLFPKACCTEHDLVGYFLSAASSPQMAIVGADPSRLARYSVDRGARVTLAVSHAAEVASTAVLPKPPGSEAEPQFPNVDVADPADLVDDGSLDVAFLAFPGFAENFAGLAAWLPKLRPGGVLIQHWVLTSADAAAAAYIFAAQRGLTLHLATHRCSFIVAGGRAQQAQTRDR